VKEFKFPSSQVRKVKMKSGKFSSEMRSRKAKSKIVRWNVLSLFVPQHQFSEFLFHLASKSVLSEPVKVLLLSEQKKKAKE
jgi:hypothetical protein